MHFKSRAAPESCGNKLETVGCCGVAGPGSDTAMFVLKRDGRKEPVHFDKITARITKLSYGLNPEFCDPVRACPPEPTPAGARQRCHDGEPRLRCLPRLSGRAAQVLVAQKVTTGVYKGVTTSELDELAAETAASMTANHPDYAVVRWMADPRERRARVCTR